MGLVYLFGGVFYSSIFSIIIITIHFLWLQQVPVRLEAARSSMQLYSIPQNLSSVQPGESVTFTRTTSGSPILVWSSIHYVSESGLQLFFGSEDTVGLLKHSPNNASVANLTMVDGLVLESELHIIVSSKYTRYRSTVTCFNNAQLVNASISFDVGEKYSLPFRYYYNIVLIINFLNVCVLLCKHLIIIHNSVHGVVIILYIQE